MSQCSDWEELLRYEQNYPLPTTTGPLWRMRVLQATPTTQKIRRGSVLYPSYRTWIVGIFHHLIMDGLARQNFWKDFLNTIYTLAQRRNPHRTSPPPLHMFASASTIASLESLPELPSMADNTFMGGPVSESLPPPVSSVMPGTLLDALTKPIYAVSDEVAFQIGKGLTMFFRKLMVKKRNPFSVMYPAEHYRDRQQAAHTSIVPLLFDPSTTKKFIQTCKQHNIPLNSVLTATAASAAAQLIGKEDQKTSLYTTQAISTRRWMQKAIKDKPPPLRTESKTSTNPTPPPSPLPPSHSPPSPPLLPIDKQDSHPDVLSHLSPSLLSPSSCRGGLGAPPRIPALAPAVADVKSDKPAPKADGLPRLGCFTCLMGLGLEVPAHSTRADHFWQFASTVNTSIHSKVDRPTPTNACSDWDVVTKFLKNNMESERLDNMLELLAPKPRPSVFLISNTGNWDTTDLRKGNGASARGPRKPTMLAGLSRYPRTPTIVHTSIDSPRSILHEHVDNMDSGSDSDSEVRGGGDFEMEIESSWSCVSQHGVGNNLFSHNLVTISGRLNWSLQYASNFVSRSLAQKYAKTIHDTIMKLIDLDTEAEEGFPAFLMTRNKALAGDTGTTPMHRA
ncbi:unnamed protein product [Vitrella brassicaformis CCMP3155]|uniref:Condensation domain-containing protein n=1 Tax=Vitrella brassicaformis (strain CCMP3155) TaxID=1169540 RepID=A0A0G4FBU7_VITBC|nr:unnamed protein product [Vitrella brassicaformis CCMP3155]|eukprot:CEM10086.1 unnamed protein product [Vitrella brassicaformis CCMP3155]